MRLVKGGIGVGRQNLWAQAAKTAISSRWGPSVANGTGGSLVNYVGRRRGPEGCFWACASLLTTPSNELSSLFALRHGECGCALRCSPAGSGRRPPGVVFSRSVIAVWFSRCWRMVRLSHGPWEVSWELRKAEILLSVSCRPRGPVAACHFLQASSCRAGLGIQRPDFLIPQNQTT